MGTDVTKSDALTLVMEAGRVDDHAWAASVRVAVEQLRLGTATGEVAP